MRKIIKTNEDFPAWLPFGATKGPSGYIEYEYTESVTITRYDSSYTKEDQQKIARGDQIKLMQEMQQQFARKLVNAVTK